MNSQTTLLLDGSMCNNLCRCVCVRVCQYVQSKPPWAPCVSYSDIMRNLSRGLAWLGLDYTPQLLFLLSLSHFLQILLGECIAFKESITSILSKMCLSHMMCLSHINSHTHTQCTHYRVQPAALYSHSLSHCVCWWRCCIAPSGISLSSACSLWPLCSFLCLF